MIFKKVFLFIAFFLCIFLFNRCAQVVPLTGGARDTTPPGLVSVTPANRSINVPAKKVRIVFKFNEIISAQSASQKLVINPLTSEMPDIEANGKTLTVSFDKDLEPNTTYLLQFGNSVVDIHEANPYPNLTYIFSTGPDIDTAYITGRTVYALSQKSAGDISVMLYRNLSDSAPLVSKPDYVTKTDEKGNYFLSAIKPGKYKVIAVGDKNKNQQYDITETFAFREQPLTINRDTVDLNLSTAETDKVFIKKKLQSFWGFNKYVLNDTFPNSYMITEKSIDTDKYQYELRNDTLEIYYKELYDRDFEFILKNDRTAFDTILLNLPKKTTVDSSVQKGTSKLSFRAEKGAYGAKNDEVLINFSLPVKQIDKEKCLLVSDKKEKAVFTSEKANEGGNLVTTYLPNYKRRLLNTLDPAKSYVVMLLPGAVQTFWGTSNADTLKASFKTMPSDELGSLTVKLVLPESVKKFVLQVLNEKGNVLKEYAGTNKKDLAAQFYNLAAGDHLLRLIDDTDQNEKFSPADHLKKRQPESVYFYEKPVKIPAGWDVEAEWKLNLKEKK